MRRRAVSYRKNPPVVSSVPRQEGQRARPPPTPNRQRTFSTPQAEESVLPGRIWSFCKEDFSCSPIDEQATFTRRSGDLVAREVRTPFVSSRQTRTAPASTATTEGAASSVQEPYWSEVESCDYSSSQSSSSPLDAFDFGLGQNSTRASSKSNSPVYDFLSTKFAVEHPNLANFKISFPAVDSCPEDIAEDTSEETSEVTVPQSVGSKHPNIANFKFTFPTIGTSSEKTAKETSQDNSKESVPEPDLPALASERGGRGPRGLSSAIAQACRKFEPVAQSTYDKGTGLRRRATEPQNTVPRLDLPSFPRLSFGLGEEVSKGPAPSIPEQGDPVREPSSEDMDLLNPESAMAMTEHRREAIRMAKSQEAAVVEKCKRSGVAPPGYTFDELIGKGSFGRVYKGCVLLTLIFGSADIRLDVTRATRKSSPSRSLM